MLGRRRLTWILIAVLVLALAGAGGGVLAWAWYNEKPSSVSVPGSSTVEFVPRAAPVKERRPKRVVLNEPWTTYAYDLQRTHLAFFPLRPPYRRIWTVRTGYYIEFPPAVAYDRVFVAQLKGRFFAIDAKTGDVIWQKRFRACTAASPTVSKGVLYQPYLPQPCDYASRSRRGFIVAMKVQGGKELWRFPVTTEASLLLRKGVLYFGGWDGYVYALRIRDRKVLWKYRADHELNSSPAYANGTIYIGSNGGTLYALDVQTGKPRWTARSFASRRWGHEYFYATPTVAYGRVFIGNSDGIVYAFGATTGRLCLGAPDRQLRLLRQQRCGGGTIYVGSYDGALYALDAATGRVKWRFQAASAIHGAPTVMNGVVYFSSCGTCGHRNSRSVKLGARVTYALDARKGKKLWTFPDGRYSPVVADSRASLPRRRHARLRFGGEARSGQVHEGGQAKAQARNAVASARHAAPCADRDRPRAAQHHSGRVRHDAAPETGAEPPRPDRDRPDPVAGLRL